MSLSHHSSWLCCGLPLIIAIRVMAALEIILSLAGFVVLVYSSNGLKVTDKWEKIDEEFCGGVAWLYPRCSDLNHFLGYSMVATLLSFSSSLQFLTGLIICWASHTRNMVACRLSVLILLAVCLLTGFVFHVYPLLLIAGYAQLLEIYSGHQETTDGDSLPSLVTTTSPLYHRLCYCIGYLEQRHCFRCWNNGGRLLSSSPSSSPHSSNLPGEGEEPLPPPYHIAVGYPPLAGTTGGSAPPEYYGGNM